MKKLLFIVNPRAGKTKSSAPLFDAVAALSSAGYLVRVFVTKAGGDARRVAAEWGPDYDTVVCAGGDGTLNETISGLMTLPQRPLLGYLPNGSTNDFAASLHLSSDPRLAALDETFRDIVAGASRRLLVFGDRFPLLYFCRAYGLDYRAAFHGCAGDTEPSLATLKYLIDLVNEQHIPVVYTIELSSRKVAQAIAETTGAQVRTFHSCQTVSRAEFDSGVTYLQLMEANADALREGLS
jgi:hypothetical protein